MADTELAKRLEKLERDNTRLKRGGLALLVLLVALTTIYATRPVPDVIKAHKFEAVDSAGAPQVVVGAVSPNGPWISLGIQKVPRNVGNFNYGAVTISDSKSFGPSIRLMHLLQRGTGGVDLGVSLSDEPQISLFDAQGFTMDLGSTNTVTQKTGETQQTSAASIIMFGNGKKHLVIWQAP